MGTVPWDKVDIRVLTVETHFAGHVYPGDRREVIAYMEEVGYRHIPNAHKGQDDTEVGVDEKVHKKQDDLFVRRDVPLLKEEAGTPDCQETGAVTFIVFQRFLSTLTQKFCVTSGQPEAYTTFFPQTYQSNLYFFHFTLSLCWQHMLRS